MKIKKFIVIKLDGTVFKTSKRETAINEAAYSVLDDAHDYDMVRNRCELIYGGARVIDTRVYA